MDEENVIVEEMEGEVEYLRKVESKESTIQIQFLETNVDGMKDPEEKKPVVRD